MAVLDTVWGLRRTRERAKRVRFEQVGTLMATNVQDAIAALAAASGAGIDLSPYMKLAGNQTTTGGFGITPFNVGTVTTGTVTPNPMQGNYQYLSNAGAFTLAAPAIDCAIDIEVTNATGVGAITFTGFTVGANTGDALTTNVGDKFIVSLRRINGIATYIIKALQ